MKQISKLFMCLFMLFCLVGPVHARERGFYIANDESGIPDTALYEFIKIQTKQNEVYSNDLVGLTELTLSDRVYSIRSLKGLSLMNLENLKSLTLDISTLSTLEDVLGLTMLEKLTIQSNSLTEIDENIHLLSNLHSFELNGSMVTSLPENFFTMTSLNSLTLNSVPLEELDKNIELLQFLDEISLVNVTFDIPEQLYSLVHLKKLKFSQMQLTELSDKIVDLIHLEELNLENNAFVKIPSMLYEMPSLQVLNMRQNQVSEVSEKIENLIRLRELDLSYNLLTTLPVQLTNLGNLNTLAIQENQIECLSSDFGLLKLNGVLDFFAFNGIEKCGVVEVEPVVSVNLTFEGNVKDGGYSNNSVAVVSDIPVYFMVDSVTDSETSTRKIVSGEGKHVVSAVLDGQGVMATVSFTIDTTSPSIAIQGNDLKESVFLYDVAIESNEEGYFVVNGVKHSNREQMIILSENNEYEVYLEDVAGNRSNVLNFSIQQEEVVVVNEEPKPISTFAYIAFVVILMFLSWGTYVFLRQGAINDQNNM